MKRLLFLIFLLLASRASALIDFNQNGISDPAERHLNQGQLLAAGTDVHAKLASGWSLSEIATAGLSPDDATQGILQIEGNFIPPVFHQDSGGNQQILTPAAYTLTFLAAAGKSYAIEASQDLSAGSWIIVDQFTGGGSSVTQTIALTQPDGSIPPKLFLKVHINDIDSDFDGLLDVEEIELGTDPNYAWSDSDYLSDGEEVLRYHTDPLNPMSDGVTLDHEKVLGFGQGDGVASTYAPEVNLLMVERGISYHFTNMDDPKLDYGSLFTWRDWDSKPAAINDTINKQIPFGNLAERLATTFPYPSHPPLPKYGASDSFGYIGFREIDPQDSTVTYAVVSQSKAWLHVSTPAEVFKTRYGMLMTYTYPRTGIPSVLLDVSPLSFTVPAGKYDSEPMEIGTHGGELHQYGGIVEFTHDLPADLGWDDTGTELWQALRVGEVVDGKLRFAASLPQEVADLLVVSPAIGNESNIQVVGQDLTGPDGPVFKVRGLAPTGPEGAAVQLRLKNNPGVVFAVLRIRVFKPVVVPVSIFRIWDSRVPESDFEDGPADNEIMIALASAFSRQGNIIFDRHPTSRKIDLRYDPTKPDTAPDQPLMFLQDGSFPYSASLEALDTLTEKQSPAPAKITIHIVKKYGNGLGMVGSSLESSLTSVISSTEKPFQYPNGEHYVFAHEMGHLLHLSTKAVGQLQMHDRGPWPAVWKPYQFNGLMHEDDASSLWIRQEDWFLAHKTAIDKKLDESR